MRRLAVAVAVLFALGPVTSARAQFGARYDSVTHFGRVMSNLAYGGAMGFVYSGYDQIRNDPSRWNKTWDGYGKRVVSNVGEFVIQEAFSDGLAVVMHRPQGYKPCNCGNARGTRVNWALAGAVMDQMPDGSRRVAYPRILGSFVGSAAQASWRPSTGSRANILITNGVSSIVIGGLINLYYEFK